jgi:hypothetical protein
MKRPSTSRTVVVGVISAVTAALIAAQPAIANGNGNGVDKGNVNGNGKALGHDKQDPGTDPDPGSGGTSTGGDSTGGGSSGGGSGDTGPGPNAAPVNSFAATLAFVGSDGKRVAVGSSAVRAVVTIRNTSTTSNSFGSARVNLPSAFTVCPTSLTCTAAVTDPSGWQISASGSTIQIRGNSTHMVAPAASIVIEVWVSPHGSCNVLTGLSWPVTVWASTSLSGSTFTGGPTTPLGFLRFTGNTLPVATAYNVGMHPAPQVASFDGCGAALTTPPAITLTDDFTPTRVATGFTQSSSGNVSTLDGVTFTGFNFTDSLTANATNFTPSDPSSSFLVAEKVQPCNSASNCAPLTLTSQPKTAAVIAPVFDPDNPGALVSGSALVPDNSLCDVESNIDPRQISSTIVVDTPVSYKLTLTLDKSLVNLISNNGAPFMGVCMAKPGQPGQVLSDCFKGGVTTPPPCVVSRNKHKANEVIVISVPAGDPHFNIH